MTITTRWSPRATTALTIGLTLGLSGCGSEVWLETDSDGPPAAVVDPNGGQQEPVDGLSGMPCHTLHGYADLTSYTSVDNYASSAFSFEYASQDAAVTGNEFDVLYEQNWFSVNMVVDDDSTIVDLGALPLQEVPANVDVDDYPTGHWGEHDALQAYPHHTYFVISLDHTGRLVSAFRVLELEPAKHVRIEWIRSVHPDRMVVPTSCF